VPVDSSLLASLGLCTQVCNITSSTHINHPVFGPSTLVTTISSASGSAPGTARIGLVDADGKAPWSFTADPQMFDFKLGPSPVDKAGHVFINYDPGRYNGVIVLAPVGHGFDDFGSFPKGDDPRNWRYYDAVTSDPDGNGIFLIDKSEPSCVPSCAAGGITHVRYRWNGSTYVQG
jgi:hypothetical protein